MNHRTVSHDFAEEHPFGDAGQVIFAIVFLTVWIIDSFFRLTTFPTIMCIVHARVPASTL